MQRHSLLCAVGRKTEEGFRGGTVIIFPRGLSTSMPLTGDSTEALGSLTSPSSSFLLSRQRSKLEAGSQNSKDTMTVSPRRERPYYLFAWCALVSNESYYRSAFE